ncbi:HAMP domain-containing protein [Paenibacillus barcinonensis]|uniref:histidine kinase n=1 Tax=Paenibacillus barcinonensis TaxID=198119 RepID=A0A2V4VVP9_PAEBA|nr:ATP-binding protein [Paenibacillus barcinonensis]PYE51376.1 two-component system sensor histidine kinase ResE [Paenibacillus barcinonensis]QKS55772.1 HAMP domain-containing protein [Paenibacillus barcinonensis]
MGCVLIALGLFLLPYIDTNFAETESRDIKRLFTYICIVGFSLTTFFALFLFTKITQPMQQLIQAANAIRKGNYGMRLSLRTNDEIGELANTFNHMAIQLEDTIRNLNHEKEHLASVLRSMTDAVITFDGEGKVILTNPPGEKIMQAWYALDWAQEDGSLEGYTAGKPSRDVPEPLVPLFRLVMEQGGDQSSNVHVQQGVWSVQMAPLYADSVVRGAVAVLRDVTEEVKMEKMRRDFVANVSHEIRTPLSMMQGYSEALLDGMATSPEESEELIQVIHDESLRMGRLVKDLLDLARMDAGHTDMNMREVELGELLERIYRKFMVRSKEQGIQLQFDCKQEISLQQADEDRLEQVFTNLLDNAFRHTPEGKSVVISVERITHMRTSFARVCVKDQGVGIPSSDVPFIFERFYKADKARVRGESVGTGLGLAIVKNIVDAHQGTIQVNSVLGEGTEFILQFPLDSSK